MSKSNPTLHSIVSSELRNKGFDGLFNTDGGCACKVDDLMPCDEPNGECEAGYKFDGCTCGEGCSFHIQRDKPEPEFSNIGKVCHRDPEAVCEGCLACCG